MAETLIHYEHFVDTEATIRSGIDQWQSGLETTNQRMVWANETPDYLFYVSSGWKVAIADGAVTYLSEWFEDVHVQGSIYLADYIYGNGDADTYIHRSADAWNIAAGNISFLNLVEDTASYVGVNVDGNDIDIRAYDVNTAVLLWADAGDSRVGIGTSTPDCKLEVAIEDAGTNSVTDVLKITHTTTDTPTTGFGAGILAELETNCGVQLVGRLSWAMTDATGAADTYAAIGICTSNTVVERLRVTDTGITIGNSTADAIISTNGNYGISIEGNTSSLYVGSGAGGYFYNAGSSDVAFGVWNDNPSNDDGGRKTTLSFLGTKADDAGHYLAKICGSHVGTGDDRKGALTFYTNDGNDTASLTARMRIDDTGLLTLYGNEIVQNTSPSMTLWNTEVEDSDNGRESALIWQGSQSGGEESYLAKIVGSHDGAADDEKGQFEFYTNDGNDATSPTLRLTIDSAGLATFAGAVAVTGDVYTTALTTWTPTIAVAAGTAPQYTTTTAYYKKIGNFVWCSLYLSGDGGAEGAGAAAITITTPTNISANWMALGHGRYVNSTTYASVTVQRADTNKISLVIDTAGAYLTGDGQNNATRTIMVSFAYEAA